MRFYLFQAFVPAVVIGAFGAPAIWTFPLYVEKVMQVGWWDMTFVAVTLTLFLGVCAFPIVFFCLGLFGVPALYLFRPFLRARWMVAIAAAGGSLGGKMVAHATGISSMLDWTNEWGLLLLLFGLCSGTAWCALYQRALNADDGRADNTRP